ncbi:hypothetical protein ACFLRT_03310 [Acidobacteriota bacterium]
MKTRLFRLMWVVVILGVLFYPGCKKSESSEYSQLYYTWEWVQSSGGIGGVVMNPASEGYTQSIDFEENGSYTLYRNNLVVSSGTYTITRAQSILDNEEYDMVVFDDGSPPQAITQLSDNELTLREECFDCFTHIYRR